MRVIALYEHLRLCQVAVYIWVFVSAGRSAVRCVPSAVQRPWLNWHLRRAAAPVSSQPRHRRCRHRATTDPLHSQPRSPPSRRLLFSSPRLFLRMPVSLLVPLSSPFTFQFIYFVDAKANYRPFDGRIQCFCVFQ